MKVKFYMPITAGLLVLTTCAENLENKITEIKVIEEMAKEETIPAPTVETAFDFVQTSGGIDEYRCTLNGLSVLLMEDHSAPVATFMVSSLAISSITFISVILFSRFSAQVVKISNPAMIGL